MTSREKIQCIANRSSNGSFGFWTGNPHPDTIEIYLKKLNFTDREELYQYLNDDCRWIRPDEVYNHPEGKPMFDVLGGKERISLNQPGVFAECESLQEIEDFPWPNPEHLDFIDALKQIRQHPDKAVFTGCWSPFFHRMCDFFGMDNYFVKMYTDPIIVEAVTEHVVDFFVEANTRFFEVLKDEADYFFFGNDFGSQQDLLISPKLFKKFVLPGFKRLIDVAKKYDKKVLLHSCGAIAKVIPMLIEAGIDALHPLQAKAVGMEAENLKQFKNEIAFVGGVDTQELLIHATSWEIKDEVYRLRDVLGPNLVVSPSHEAILPNVPLENVIAMAEAARIPILASSSRA